MVGIIKVKKIFLVLIYLIFSVLACTDPKEVAESESQEAVASVAFAAQMELGLEVYNNNAQCGMCHTLQAAGSEGQIGTNLDQLKPSMLQVVSTVTNGIGVMPSFEGTLSSEEIEAVSYFVSTSANQ